MKISRENKLEIIRPFFIKKKKLTEIEKETSIPYSTLKRWVTRYKNHGEEGLIKKERFDKNTFKSIDDTNLEKIKILYKNNYSLSCTKLYEKARDIFETSNLSISYPTFSRIINNLDDFIKIEGSKSIKKQSGLEYGLIQKPVSLPFFDNKNKIFYLTVFYEKESLKVINFLFEEDKKNFSELLDFIRQGIIISGVYPRYVSIDNNIDEVNKNLIKNIFFETNIEIVQEDTHQDLTKIVSYIDKDILKEISPKKNKTLEDVKEFVRKYFFISTTSINYDYNLYREELHSFLKSTNRRVYSYGVRIKNKIYNSDSLKNLEGSIIKVYYGNIYTNYVYLYSDQEFLGRAYKV